MKAKTLRNKTTGNYLQFTRDEYDDGTMLEWKLPEILDVSVTLEGLIDHYNSNYPHIDTSEFEVIELEIFEAGVVGADICNKLSPIKNLLALIGVYFIEKSSGKKILLKGVIDKEIKQSRISVEYLTKLFK